MPGEVLSPGQPAGQPQGDREVPEGERKLAKDLLARIDAANKRNEEPLKEFEKNRKRLRGRDPDADNKRYRTNLFFSNLASMRPQVYAKDPEYAVRPSKGVPQDQLKKVQAFCNTSEILLHKVLVKDAKLKKRTKRQLTAAYTTAVGWAKCQWQEDRRKDPQIIERLKDTQDNIERLTALRAGLNDPGLCQDQDLEIEKLKQALAGLQTQAEVTVARGIAHDFVMSEDIIILDESVLEVQDYLRADAIAHRVWMTPAQFKERFGHDAKKARVYKPMPNGSKQAAEATQETHRCLLCVYEVWDQTSNRVLYVCEGESGYCKEPMSPDWPGERWYPFFLLLFNEIDGAFYPQSDVELITPLVDEYNRNRDDLVRDRKGALPLNVVRAGGSLKEDDIKAIKNREGSDVIVVSGVPGTPLNQDIYSGTLGTLNPANYDTTPARVDIEQTLGGGDASRGTVMEAKTATEAEIVSQGLRSRSAERTDITEDMLSEIGAYVLEILLRKMTPQEVTEIAGPEANWPQLSADQIFRLVSVEVLGGSTGKPDRLQEQDRWTKMLPVLRDSIMQAADLQAQGKTQQAQAIIELAKETLRRFEERFDIEQFLPKPKEGEEDGNDPMQDPRVQQLVQKAQEEMQALQQQVKELEGKVASNEAQAQASVQVGQANAQRDVEVAELNARRDIEVARITAPIEAEAKVLVARIQAAAQPATDTLPASQPIPDVPPVEPIETEPLSELIPDDPGQLPQPA